MKSNKSFLLAILVAALALTSCSGLPKNAGGGGGGGGTNKVSFTMVADTPPANLGLVSFKITITSIVLTSSTGTQTTLNINGGTGYTFDLVRLQSDSAFLGTLATVPTGANSTITVHFTNPEVAFLNGTGAAITNVTPQCPSNAVCSIPFNASGSPVITFSQAISGNTGFGIDFNLANALTLSGTTLNVNLTNSGNTNVVSAFKLPRQPSTLAAGQLDLIEDFTGVVSTGASGVTITPATTVSHAPITALTNGSTVYDPDPTDTLCLPPASQSSCVISNQAASMDAILNSDGTFTVQEFEPLLATLKDTVEGTVVFINSNNQTQFDLITTGILPAAQGSLIGSLSIGDPLTVNLAVGPAFWVDTKGLAVGGFSGNFQGMTNTTALHLGQTVAVHVSAFTAATGNTPAISSNTDTVTLRWSRLIATPTGASSPSLFNITSLPGYFGFTQASVFGVQIFTGTQGTDGVTNLDGIGNGSAPGAAAVGIRALFIENPGNTLNPAFFAAKVRQH